jgi:hypothetical protein
VYGAKVLTMVQKRSKLGTDNEYTAIAKVRFSAAPSPAASAPLLG